MYYKRMSVNTAMKPYIGQTFHATQQEIRDNSHMRSWFEAKKPEETLAVKIVGIHYHLFICEVEGRGETILSISYCKKKKNYMGYEGG